MPTTKRIWSIRQILMLSHVGFAVIASIISLIIVSSQFGSSFKTLATNDIKYWANEVAQLSQNHLIAGQKEALQNQLHISNQIPRLKYLHVYRLADNDKFELFYSYQRNERRSAIAEKSKEIANLLEPMFRESFIEFMYPIRADDQIIGYVYLQSNKDYIAILDNQLVIICLTIMAIILLLTIFIAFRLDQYISSPFLRLSEILQTATRQKNFTTECEAMPYREADILARNINILFARMDRHIEQLGLAEQQSIEHSHELENKVNKRTQALKESNQELLSTLEKLHQFQHQLVESEKMASLGDMVAGVAHEVNTPIGLGVTASTLLADRLKEIKDAYEDKTLKSSQLKKFLHEGSENIAIIYRNLNRAADLISSFKKVAVDQSSEDIREFNIHELFSEVLLTLGPQLNNLPYVVDIDCPKELIITSKPGPINQILINLIMNSIIHGFEGKDNGTISIRVMPLSNQLNITFADDGVGVDESIKKKIFEPFTTTKRGEGGSGLGLHLVYNLVTQALGGTIILTSETGQGVNFEINFPIN